MVLGLRLATSPPNPVLFSGHTLEPASLKQMRQGTVLTVACVDTGNTSTHATPISGCPHVPLAQSFTGLKQSSHGLEGPVLNTRVAA